MPTTFASTRSAGKTVTSMRNINAACPLNEAAADHPEADGLCDRLNHGGCDVGKFKLKFNPMGRGVEIVTVSP